MIKGIDHIAICSQDPKALQEWYVKTFGFEVFLDGFLRTPDGVMLEFLGSDEDGGIQGKGVSGIRHIAFRVDDFDALVDKIRDLEVEIVSEPSDGPNNRTFFFRDPECNILQFQYWKIPID